MRAFHARKASRRGGFTLVETIVACVVAMILIGAVAGILAFSARSMSYQKAQGNAATIASTVKSSIEGTLRTAKISKVTAGNAESGASIEFATTKSTAYLGNTGDQYKLYIDRDKKQLYIANKSGSKSGAVLPAETYIDGDTIDWTVEGDPTNIRITVNVYSGQDASNLATASTTIESVNSQ